MSVAFFKGQQLGRDDLDINLENTSGTPANAAEIYYALYDFTTGREVLLGVPRRSPANPEVGKYYASIIIPLDANVGSYRVRWTFKETFGGPIHQAIQEFDVIDKSGLAVAKFNDIEMDLVRRLRTVLRDARPDRDYHFRPPAHEETVGQFNRVFGHIWVEEELLQFLEMSMDAIIAAPPRTPFQSISTMSQWKPEWRTLLLTGAANYALLAMMISWIADEFSYSIGGVSLDIDKSSKYEAAANNFKDLFDSQLERAKSSIKIVKGLQQSRFGVGIRSSFGPYSGRGVLTPSKFIGF
jgi:hypothetical protein